MYKTVSISAHSPLTLLHWSQCFPRRILPRHTEHTFLHANNWSCLWTALGWSLLLGSEEVSPFHHPLMPSYLAISATLSFIWRSWTAGQRKSDRPLPPPTPSWCSLRWGIALPSWDTPFALYQPHWTLSRSHMASVSYTANLLYPLMKTSPVFSFCRRWNPAASPW